MVVRNAASMGNYGAAWEYGGYSGSGNVKELLGSLAGRTAIVAGNAQGVFQEVASILADDVVVFASNDCGVYLPQVDHMISLHRERLKLWVGLRLDGSGQQYGNRDLTSHTISQVMGIDFHWDFLTPTFALSGYFAMQIAYLMGCERIILCGCPGDPVPRFFEANPRKDNFGYGNGTKGAVDKGIREQVVNEMKRLPEFKRRVRSMSGWTKEVFGSPV